MGLRFFYSYSIAMIRAFSLVCLTLGLGLPAQAAFQDSAATLPVEVQEAPTRGFSQGQFLPDVELPRIDGKGTIRLRDLMGDFEKPGKKLLLIHFASW